MISQTMLLNSELKKIIEMQSLQLQQFHTLLTNQHNSETNSSSRRTAYISLTPDSSAPDHTDILQKLVKLLPKFSGSYTDNFETWELNTRLYLKEFHGSLKIKRLRLYYYAYKATPVRP
jgi:hypothetical protein